MIEVLVYCRSLRLYMDEFNRRFQWDFDYKTTGTIIQWEHMRIRFVTSECRGYRADIAIGFNQDGVNLFTMHSRINIKEKRTTTYSELLDAINNDGTFNWSKYLKSKKSYDWMFL